MKDQLRTTVLVSEGWQEAAMSAERQLGLAGTAAGRVVLHLLAFNFMARFGVAGWQESGPHRPCCRNISWRNFMLVIRRPLR